MKCAAAEPLPAKASVVRLIDPSRTTLAFVGACCYLASQAFQIPLMAVGPSWAVWPNLSDLAFAVLLLSLLTGSRHLRMLSAANRKVFSGLLVLFGATVAAFLAVSVRDLFAVAPQTEKSADFGLFHIYRFAQFVLVYRVIAGLPLTRSRARTLSLIAEVTLALAFLGVLGTYTSLLPTPLLVSHLPSERSVAGPWVTLSMGQWYEAGTIGYNHSHVAVQLVMLAGLAVGLRLRRCAFLDIACLALATAGVFLSASRAGMAAALFLLVAYFFRRPSALTIAVLVFGLAFSAFSGFLGDLGIGVAETAERQLTLRRPLDPENLSGRAGIWQDSLDFLLADPIRWVVGAGPGGAMQLGNNAHMLALQIILEGGVIGLTLFFWVMYTTMTCLYRFERGARAIFWTTGALLVSSFTQETLYPVPSMGHFLGLYLFSVALVLGLNSNEPAREYNPRPCREVRECAYR
jgi:hypothetical protein